ncbi:hypothetical protein F5Y19DRAFT_479829 [Xylariaceae sp. FL1651]|nr:hypothetical protein F5Y19DRAFT_479829 [Xylariaceae sp. FL1651]
MTHGPLVRTGSLKRERAKCRAPGGPDNGYQQTAKLLAFSNLGIHNNILRLDSPRELDAQSFTIITTIIIITIVFLLSTYLDTLRYRDWAPSSLLLFLSNYRLLYRGTSSATGISKSWYVPPRLKLVYPPSFPKMAPFMGV